MQGTDDEFAFGESVAQSRRRESLPGVAEQSVMKRAEQSEGCAVENLESVIAHIERNPEIVGRRRCRQPKCSEMHREPGASHLLKAQQIRTIGIHQLGKFSLGA